MLTKWVQHLRLGAVPVGSEIYLEAWESRSEKLIAATAVCAGTLLAVMKTSAKGRIFGGINGYGPRRSSLPSGCGTP